MASAPIGSLGDGVGQARSTTRRAAARRRGARPVRRTRRTSSSRRRPRDGGASRQVARVVGGDVHPAEAEPGHDEHQRADRPGRRSRSGSADTVAQSTCGGRERDEDDGEHAGDDRDDRLQAHDHGRSRARPPRRRARPRRAARRPWSRCRRPSPSRSKTVAVASVARIVSTVSQPDGQQPGDRRGQLVAAHAERRAREHHRRRRAALAGQRDERRRAGTRTRSRPRRRPRPARTRSRTRA